MVDLEAEAVTLRLKLEVLQHLSTIAVDAVSEYLTPAQCSSSEYVDRHFALCAHPFALLTLIGADKGDGEGHELYQALQGVCTRDLHQHLVCEYTRKQLLSTTTTTARGSGHLRACPHDHGAGPTRPHGPPPGARAFARDHGGCWTRAGRLRGLLLSL